MKNFQLFLNRSALYLTGISSNLYAFLYVYFQSRKPYSTPSLKFVNSLPLSVKIDGAVLFFAFFKCAGLISVSILSLIIFFVSFNSIEFNFYASFNSIFFNFYSFNIFFYYLLLNFTTGGAFFNLSISLASSIAYNFKRLVLALSTDLSFIINAASLLFPKISLKLSINLNS